MKGKSLGAYRIGRKLGSGGMGTVYEATRGPATGGSTVALKILHPYLLGRDGSFKRFLREAEIGKRVRHENVVRTLDADAVALEGESYHFLVMELVDGRTLREILDDLGAVPEALVREVTRQAAAGLAGIHAAGAIHRDLKPENVLITDTDEVRIMDLGVARELSDSTQLTRDGHFAGSVRYAAPEQFDSRPLTPSIDLYALGLLAYELTVGEHPFPADDTSRLIAAHLKESPPRARDRAPDVTPFLSELIDVLLAKQPGDRIDSAATLERVLSEGEASAWWRAREGEALRETTRPQVPVRRTTRMMGRDAELSHLRQGWEAAKGGEGSIVLVEGETGIGKSRLLDDLLTGIDASEAHVLYGSYAPSGGIGGLSEAVVSHFGDGGLEAGLRSLLQDTPALVPTFAALVRHEAPPDGAEALSLSALHTLYARLLRGLSLDRPLIWVVEDLHFADSIGWGLVQSLARTVEGWGVLLLLTGRPGLPVQELSHLGRLPAFRRIRLERLTEAEAVAILRVALRSQHLAERIGPSIHRKSDGVPFFLFELLRGMKEEQYISESDDGSFVETKSIRDLGVPSAVRDLVSSRLASLEPEDLDLLEAAAVQGFRFDAELVATVVGKPLIRVLQALARIERSSGVVVADGRMHRFDHHHIQEVVYGDIHSRLREEYHLISADGILTRSGDDGETPPDVAVAVADHYLKSSDPSKTLPFILPALTHMSLGHRHEAAVAMAGRALEVDGADRFEILMIRIRSLHELGGRAEEAEALAEAERIATPEQRGRVLRARGRHLLRTSRIEEARESLGEALRSARAVGDRKAESDTLGQLGAACAHRGDYEGALGHYRERLDLCRENDDRAGEAAACDSVGEALGGLGRDSEAGEYHERAIRLSRAIGNRRLEASSTGNLASRLRSMGDLEGARRLGERYLELTREVGHREGIAIGTGNLARALSALGDIGAAAKMLQEAAVLCRELGNRLTEGMYKGMLGTLQGEMGDFESATRNLELARELFEEIGDRRLVGYCARETGDLAAVTGNVELADRLFHEAEEEFAAQPFPPGEAGLMLSRARLAATRGEPGAADRLAAAARALETCGEQNAWLEAEAWQATLNPAALPRARDLFRDHRHRLAAIERVRIQWLLYRAGGEETDREAAREGLLRLAEKAPGRARDWIRSRIPLHREILAHGNDASAPDD